MDVTDILKKWPHYKCPRCGLEQLLIGYYKGNPAETLGKLGGKVGGKSKSPAKQAASRANGKKHTAGKPEEPKPQDSP